MVDKNILKAADDYFDVITPNDFYSFIRSDFKDGKLIDLSYEKACRDARLSDELMLWLDNYTKVTHLDDFNIIMVKAIKEYCKYIKLNEKYYWFKSYMGHNSCPVPYLLKGLILYKVTNTGELEEYYNLLKQLPDTMNFILEKLKKLLKKGITMPLEECRITVSMLDSFFQPDDGALGFIAKSKHIPFDERDLLEKEFKDKLVYEINRFNSAVEGCISYIENEYVRELGDKVGLCNQPEGLEYYKALINVYTSYDLSPEYIHETGLKNLQVTREKMQAIIKKLGFDCTIEEFNERLSDNKDYKDPTSHKLKERFEKHLDKIRPLLDDYFYNQPETACEVCGIDPSREGSTSWGYYSIPVGSQKTGIYFFSGAELDKRSQIRAAAITYHELLPGHHFQCLLAAEDETLPKVCRFHFNTAYADGWAEYAADLANEMGLYNDYDLYGRYLWDLILCTRLVVDTGMNALGWSLEKARRFMSENTTLVESEIITESLRYVMEPGQALAYKMGSLKMHELRKNYEAQKGEYFNIKDFHQRVLEMGSIPLNVVEENVNR